MIIRQFELETTGSQIIDLGGEMPVGFSVGEVDGKLVLWVQLDEDYPGRFSVFVQVVETGEFYEMQDKFVGSAVLSTGSVFHVFAKTRYVREEDL